MEANGEVKVSGIDLRLVGVLGVALAVGIVVGVKRLYAHPSVFDYVKVGVLANVVVGLGLLVVLVLKERKARLEGKQD